MSLVKGNNLVLPLGCNQMLILKRTLHVLTDVLSQVSVHSSFISSVIKVFTSFSTPVFFIFFKHRWQNHNISCNDSAWEKKHNSQ